MTYTTSPFGHPTYDPAIGPEFDYVSSLTEPTEAHLIIETTVGPTDEPGLWLIGLCIDCGCRWTVSPSDVYTPCGCDDHEPADEGDEYEPRPIDCEVF